MVEVVRKLKINRRYALSACTWCGDALNVGEDGAVCEACETPHHARCWDRQDGCGLSGCVNSPLPEIGTGDDGKHLRSDEKTCPYCEKIIYVEADICRHCGQIVSADGIYHGEQTIAPDAKHALLFGIAGFVCCFGLILGPLAFKNGMDAKKAIAADPRLRGRALAVTAQVIGAIDVVLWLTVLALRPNQLGYWMGYLAIPAIGFVLLVLFIRWWLNRI